MATSTHGREFDFIDVAALASLLRGGNAFALFDARDEGLFARSHMLFACALPLSDLEVRLSRLVQRRETLIVLTSAEGDGMAERAAVRCRALGFRNLRLLRGGNAAWERSGFALFRGIHVPSKAFGELVESHYQTPMIEPGALHAMMHAGEPVHIFDCRPPTEFHRMSVPGARNCPGADLLSRVPGQIEDDALIVISCAGRTRSIIGAQSLINAGMRNRVVALKNGTMGWHLAGYPLDHGKSDLVEPADPAKLGDVRAIAGRLRDEFGIPQIDLHALTQLRSSDRGAELMLLDVRGPWEYEAGHFPGSRNAPGGQLVQATDYFVGVRNAPIVLVDDDGVRASITATWLVQMGAVDVYVLDERQASEHFVEIGPAQAVPSHLIPHVEYIDPRTLERDLDAGTTLVLDLGKSDTYYKGHIPGARFAIRSRLTSSIPRLPRLPSVTIVADDNVTAAFAAQDVEKLYGAPARVLAGGVLAWTEAMLPTVTGLDDALDPAEDMWHIPSSPLGGLDAAMRDYLSWEVGLAAQVAREPGAYFTPGSRRDRTAPNRKDDFLDIAPVFRRRWSPRAMSGDSLQEQELHSLFEAARWAPSSGNSQPWRFVFARRGDRFWSAFFELLNTGNKRWAGRGGVLGFILSLRSDATGKALGTHAFDTGAAWQNMALQATNLGLVIHAMVGFDHQRARRMLELDENMDIHAMFVAGHPGLPKDLPRDLQLREVPSGRLPLEVLVFEGQLRPMGSDPTTIETKEVS